MWNFKKRLKAMQTQKIGITSFIKQNPQVTFGSSQSSIAKFIEQAKFEYIKSGIAESLHINKNMTNYRGEPVDLIKAETIVNKVANYLLESLEPYDGILSRRHVANSCFDFAENFHKNEISKDFSLSVKTRDAVVIDFLNYVCEKKDVNLVLGTKDLQKVAK